MSGVSVHDTPPEVCVYKLRPEQRKIAAMLEHQSKNDLYPFTKFLLARDRLVRRVHGPYCNFVTSRTRKTRRLLAPPYGRDWTGKGDAFTRVTHDEKRRFKLSLLPRSSYKTTIVNEAYPLWYATNVDPNVSILSVCESQGLSDTNMSVQDDHILNNPLLVYLYGKRLKDGTRVNWSVNATEWTNRKKRFTIRTAPQRAPSLMASSVGSALTGLHPDIIICDDIVSQATVMSGKLTDVTRSFFDSLFPLLDGPEIMQVVGTRWGSLDLYGEILDMRQEDFDVYVRAIRNPDGTPWFPEKFPERKIKALQARMTKYMFGSQYLLVPVPRSDQTLDIGSIHWYKSEKEIPPRNKMCVLVGCDPAGTGGYGSSSWAIPVLGLHSWYDKDAGEVRHDAWLLEYEKGAMTGLTAAKTIVRLVKKWNADGIIAEETAISENWITATLENTLYKNGIHSRPVRVKPRSIAKTGRILDVENGLGAFIESGGLHVDITASQFRNELQDFPSPDNPFDLLDILAYMIREANENRWFPYVEDHQSEQIDEELERILEHNRKMVGENSDRDGQEREVSGVVRSINRQLGHAA